MLADPPILTEGDAILDMIDLMNGDNRIRQIEPGFWIGGINFGCRICWDSLENDCQETLGFKYPNLGEEFDKALSREGAVFNCYGVCDSPEQFIERYKGLLEKDERTFVVAFGHIRKDPNNKGKGGGLRWSKWGGYIGDGDLQHEHLDDEDGFDDGVYVYHIYQLG